MVYLVGAGPGDPDLITVAGAKALQTCTAIIYDALANEALLNLAPPAALRIRMGKRGGENSADQNQIHAEMIRLAHAGHTVVRLKGGDPLVFARVGEEMQALAQAGVPFKVIPGISSALAAPALANIPLSYRGSAGTFAVATAHRILGADAPNWAVLAQTDTVVLLMGAARLNDIAEQLIAHGREKDFPVAAVQSASLPEQRVLFSTLAHLAQDAELAELGAPLVVVVGKVVKLGLELTKHIALAHAGAV